MKLRNHWKNQERGHISQPMKMTHHLSKKWEGQLKREDYSVETPRQKQTTPRTTRASSRSLRTNAPRHSAKITVPSETPEYHTRSRSGSRSATTSNDASAKKASARRPKNNNTSDTDYTMASSTNQMVTYDTPAQRTRSRSATKTVQGTGKKHQ